MQHPFLVFGSILGALGVGIGAFGAHALKATLVETGRTATYETAVKYHLVHAVMLMLVGVWSLHTASASPWLARAGWSFMGGTVVFSGSLYILCLTGMKWLGAITPIGGLLMIVGWLCLTAAALRM